MRNITGPTSEIFQKLRRRSGESSRKKKLRRNGEFGKQRSVLKSGFRNRVRLSIRLVRGARCFQRTASSEKLLVESLCVKDSRLKRCTPEAVNVKNSASFETEFLKTDDLKENCKRQLTGLPTFASRPANSKRCLCFLQCNALSRMELRCFYRI